MTKQKTLVELHNEYIKNTAKDAIVQEVVVFLCNLTFAVTKGVELDQYKAYVNTKVLKHSYDKRPAFEYDLLINALSKIVRYPDKVYANKQGKRGDFCFVKVVKKHVCLCVLEKEENTLEVVTFYRVPKEKYLDKFSLLWSWRDDISPHRSTLDSDQGQSTNAPQ